MKKYFSAIIAFLFSFGLNAQPIDTGSLIFTASGFNNDKGKAVIFLFRNKNKIPGEPFMVLNSSITNKMAIILFHGIPFDNYAAILLHDENGNNKIDHSLGIPSEQLGYSNNWQLGFFTGMPTFSKLKFPFTPSLQNQQIKITYKTKK